MVPSRIGYGVYSKHRIWTTESLFSAATKFHKLRKEKLYGLVSVMVTRLKNGDHESSIMKEENWSRN